MPTNKKIPPTHPGEVLLEDIMKPLGLSANKIAMAMRVPLSRVTEIIAGERAVTADTALRLARCFGTTAQFWLNLQAKYDLAMAEHEKAAEIAREVLPLREAASR
ncbi:MAG: HigA family addiction module antitoxin [Candidatus Binataceae bacterium]